MEEWRFLRDENRRWKGHVVSRDLEDEIKLDLDGRDGDSLWVSERLKDQTTGFDLPGMIFMGRSVRKVVVDGLTIEMPSQDWSILHSDFKLTYVERTFASGRKYYKLHNRFFCIVLTPEQRTEMLRQMEEQMGAAEAEATEDNRRFREAIDQVNKNLEGKGVAVFSQRAEMIRQAEDGKKGAN